MHLLYECRVHERHKLFFYPKKPVAVFSWSDVKEWRKSREIYKIASETPMCTCIDLFLEEDGKIQVYRASEHRTKMNGEKIEFDEFMWQLKPYMDSIQQKSDKLWRESNYSKKVKFGKDIRQGGIILILVSFAIMLSFNFWVSLIGYFFAIILLIWGIHYINLGKRLRTEDKEEEDKQKELERIHKIMM